MNQVPGRLTTLARTLLQQVDSLFDGEDPFRKPFRTHITQSTIVPSVQQSGRTLFEAAPDHKVTEQYRELAREFAERFAAYEGDELTPATSQRERDGAKNQVRETTHG